MIAVGQSSEVIGMKQRLAYCSAARACRTELANLCASKPHVVIFAFAALWPESSVMATATFCILLAAACLAAHTLGELWRARQARPHVSIQWLELRGRPTMNKSRARRSTGHLMAPVNRPTSKPSARSD